MREISVAFELENSFDRDRFLEDQLEEHEIRRYAMRGIVDTGAVMLVLPQDVVDKLGLRSRRKVIVTYADERCAGNGTGG